jgi:uncharacterized protein
MSQPFEFHLGDLRYGRSEPRTVSGRVSVDWHVELSRVLAEPPLFFELVVDPVPGGLAVAGVIEAAVAHRCYRCLNQWTESIVHEVDQMIVNDGDDDDDYRIDGDVYDFEDMVRDELLLALPIAPQCGPDCEGLVVEAGTDLNTDPSEDEAISSSPFSVLRDLLDSGE